MFKLDGKILQQDRAFTTSDGTQYPSNWLRLSSAEEKAALGITWEDDPVKEDGEYYWDGDINNPKSLDDVLTVDENGQPVYEQHYDPTANDGEGAMVNDEPLVQAKTFGLKYVKTAQVKDTANKLLAPTDWYVIRKYEANTAIPDTVSTFRSGVKTECDRLETAIAAAADVPALITVMNSQDWPEVK